MAAKKKFDVKSTLTIPPKQLTPDQIELAIRQIHTPEEPALPAPEATPAPPKPKTAAPARRVKNNIVPATSIVAEPPAPKYKVEKPARRNDGERKVRLSVDVSPTTHKKLKLKAIENDTDIMHYVEMLIERDLGL